MVAVVENCFALGSVIVHRNATSGTSNAGGLIGNINASGRIRNSVAAVLPGINPGKSITATGGDNRLVGRIFGSPAPSATLGSNNHAWDHIRLFSDSNYDPPNPAPENTGTRALDSKDGQDVGISRLGERSFWEGLGFTEADWDFSGIGGRGYPRLRNTDGGIMGGQQ
jgi:hypothetical protein